MTSILYRGLWVPVFCGHNTTLCWIKAFISRWTEHPTVPIPELFRQSLNKHETVAWCPESVKMLKLLWENLRTLEIAILEKNPTETSWSSTGWNSFFFFPDATKIRICAIEFAMLCNQEDIYAYLFPFLPCQDLSSSAFWMGVNLSHPWVQAAGAWLGWG